MQRNERATEHGPNSFLLVAIVVAADVKGAAIQDIYLRARLLERKGRTQWNRVLFGKV